jgi:hypothetical protein
MAEKKSPEGKPERVEIGFGGGQVVAVRLSDASMKELRSELASTEKLSSEAGRWYDLETDDGTVSLDLRQVVFVRVGGGEHRIGFVGGG